MSNTSLPFYLRAFWPLILFYVFAFVFASTYSAHAANLRTVQDTLSNPTISTASNHTITFLATGGVTGGTIVINLSNIVSSVGSVDVSDIDLEYGGTEQSLAAQAVANTWGAALSGGIITFSYPTPSCTSPCSTISAGQQVTIQIGTNASGGDAQMTNSATVGSRMGSIRTGNDSAVFAIVLLSNPSVSVGGTASIPSGTVAIAPSPAQTTTETATPETTTSKSAPEPTPTPEPAPTPAPEPAPAPALAPEPAPAPALAPEPTLSPTPESASPAGIQSTPLPSAVPPIPITIPSASSAALSGTTSAPSIITVGGGSGGTVIASIPGDAFKTVTGRTAAKFEAKVQPMSAAQAVLWTGCTNINPRRILSGIAYNVYAVNTDPEHAGDIVVEPVKPVTLTITYTDEEIEQQGFVESSPRAFAFDPENCKQQVDFIRDPLTKTITITALPKTFFAVTGDLRPGFTEREIQAIQQNWAEFVTSEIGQDDLNVPATAAHGATVDMCLKSGLFKKSVKRIILTVDGQQHRFAYDEARDCFALALALPEERGEQKIELKIIYVDDQVQIITFTARITGDFQATLLGFAGPLLAQMKAINEQVGKTVKETEPVLQTAAVAAVPLVGVANPSLVTNALNWYYYLNHFFSWLLSLLGLRKKRKPWGIVYNAVTKQVIDLVIVRLFEKGTNRLVETQVTDKNGRFSFLVSPGEYYVTATKNPLIYPSTLVHGTIDGDYANLYRQETFRIDSPEQQMALSIPLDPPKVEHAVAVGRGSLVKRWKTFVGHNPLAPLLAGFLIAELLTLYTPNPLNYTLLGINGFFVLSQMILGVHTEKAWGLVFNAMTLEPVPLAAITLFDAKEGKMLRTRLSDYFGRFSFLTPPGEYMLNVTKEGYQFPAPKDIHVQKFHHLYHGGSLAVKGKVLKTNIPLIPKEESDQHVIPTEERNPDVTEMAEVGPRPSNELLSDPALLVTAQEADESVTSPPVTPAEAGIQTNTSDISFPEQTETDETHQSSEETIADVIPLDKHVIPSEVRNPEKEEPPSHTPPVERQPTNHEDQFEKKDS